MASGEIDVSITELEDGPAGSHGRRGGDGYESRLRVLLKQNGNRPLGSIALPHMVRISVKDVIQGLFPENRYLMLTRDPKTTGHPIRMRDEWLANYQKFKLFERGFISSNYLSRADKGCSYEGMDGIKRRWLVIESDLYTLEEQLRIHQQLAKQASLMCVCYSGRKSLHGWYLVDGWGEQQCYELYVAAIGLGSIDPNLFRICQPVRLPGGWNHTHQRKQHVLIWNL